MDTTLTVDNAVAWFGAHTVTHHLDVVDRVAAFAKSPRLCRMDVKVAPDGREIAFYSRQYADGGSCVTTVFDAEDRELATYEEVADLDDVRFGFASVVEWLHTKSNVFISFYENATSDDPWLRICEPA